eukprot:13939454-Alexandrium_andersonii.AAC.1
MSRADPGNSLCCAIRNLRQAAARLRCRARCQLGEAGVAEEQEELEGRPSQSPTPAAGAW